MLFRSPIKAEPLSVALSGRYAWRAKLSNGTVIEFGREQNDEDRAAMEARVKRFVASWPQLTQQWGKQIEYADLRYPNGFAIRTASVRFLTDAQAQAAAKAAAKAAAGAAGSQAASAGNTNNNPTRLKSKNAEKTR